MSLHIHILCCFHPKHQAVPPKTASRLDALDESSAGYSHVQSEIGYIEYQIEHFSESDYVKYPEGQLVFT